MSNWDQTEQNSMWLPPRPSTSSGDQYNKHKRKDKRSPSKSFHINTNNNAPQQQRRQSYNYYNHNNHNNHNYTNYGQNTTYNDPKRVIIAKKKTATYASNDISDSFMNSTNLDEKRQREKERYLMEQQQNSTEAKLANYKQKQERYSQIKDEFGLSDNSQTRKISKKASYHQNKLKVLQRTDGGCTKFAILDLVGDMNDEQLYAELDRKSKSSILLKPIRPPIPTPHSVVLSSTPTSSVQSITKSESKGSSIRPNHNVHHVTHDIDDNNAAVIPIVKQKVETENGNENEKRMMDTETETESVPQFKAAFVPHDVGRNVRSKYEYGNEEHNVNVKSITNDVRNIDLKHNNKKNDKNNNRDNGYDDRYNERNEYSYNGKKNKNKNRNKNNDNNNNSNDRRYKSRRNERNDGYYGQSGNTEYYEDNGYDEYYERNNKRNNKNDSYYGSGRNSSYQTNQSDTSYNQSYRSNDSRYYHSRNNRKY